MYRTFLLLTILGIPTLICAGPHTDSKTHTAHGLLSQAPLRFEPDGGRYVARGPDYRLALQSDGFELTWNDADRQTGALRMRLEGANPRAAMEAADPLPSHTSYFLGADPSGWRAGVPNYARVRLRNLYKGVDLVLYGSQQSLEFDFDVAPGANPRVIRLAVSGAVHTRIEDGSLVFETRHGQVRWGKPVVYQNVAGVRRAVAGRFVAKRRGHIAFEVGGYDHGLPLVIDPVLGFSTYFGSTNNEAARGVGVDSAGNIYIAGYTTSRNLPVSVNAAQSFYGGDTMNYQTGDAFVAKFTSAGSLAAMTYLGGRGDDNGSSLAVDASGNVYVTGYTNSPDFPVTSNPFQKTMAGAGGNVLFTVGDAFITKLNSSLSQLVYSTYLGGSMDEAGIAIAIDAAGHAYVTGITLSNNFPTKNPFQATYHGSGGQPTTDFVDAAGNPIPFFVTGDAFVSELSADGSQLVFSSYLGGSYDDAATSIALDPSGNVYVAGFTISLDFPTVNALQKTFAGLEYQNEFYNLGDCFIAKISPAGALLYSTYLGGEGDDAITALAVDTAGNLYATGATTSTNFPVTAGAFRQSYSGPVEDCCSERIVGDAFVVKVKPDGSGLVYSTYIGASQDDSGNAIAVDSAGNAYVAGSTASNAFPITSDATQKTYAGVSAGMEHNNGDLLGDGFLVILNPAGSAETFGTFLGGSADDSVEGLAIDASGNIYVTGITMSTDFPVTNAYQSKFGGIGLVGRLYGDAFLTKFTAAGAGSLSASPPSVSVNYNLGSANPSPITLALSSSTPIPFSVTKTTGANWLTVTPTSGQTPANLTVTLDPTGLSAGPSTASITITSTTPGVASVVVPVTLTVGSTVPYFLAGTVVNAASGLSGPIAPGEMLVIYGVDVGPAANVGAQLTSAGLVSSNVAGTQVLFGGVAGPLVYTQSGQVSVMVPYEVAGQSSVPLQMMYNQAQSTIVTLPIAASSPALFTLNEQGTGQAAARNHVDYSINSDSNPVARGQVIELYGTGEGVISPALADGTIFSGSPPYPEPVLKVTATIGGQQAQVLYAGTASYGVAGFLQVDLVVPTNVSPGDLPVVLTIGTASSPANVTVAVN